MASYHMGNLHSADDLGLESEGTVPAGFLGEMELTACSLPSRHGRSLPIYFGDCWRCYLCTFECFDFFDVVDHMLQTHDPEPFNEADEAEQWEWGPS